MSDGGPAAAYRRLWADARAALTAWQPPDLQQAELREGYLAHLARHPDAVAKAGPSAHLTAGVLVLDESRRHVLLTLHRKAKAWLQFGGHLEATDPGVYAAAQREAAEESGLALAADGGCLQVLPGIVELNRHRLGNAFGRCREHLDVRYLGVTAGRPDPVVSDESDDVRWWPIDRLPERSAAELAGLLAAARRALR